MHIYIEFPVTCGSSSWKSTCKQRRHNSKFCTNGSRMLINVLRATPTYKNQIKSFTFDLRVPFNFEVLFSGLNSINGSQIRALLHLFFYFCSYALSFFVFDYSNYKY